jgi:hypothetical protein
MHNARYDLTAAAPGEHGEFVERSADLSKVRDSLHERTGK